MTSDAYNPDDLAFLISRGLDGDLSPGEQRRLDEALGQSESLRAQASKFAAVHRLVQRWGLEPVELDWTSHAALTQAVAAKRTDDAGSRKIDGLLRRWAGRSVDVEAIDLSAAVLREIRAEPRRAAPLRLVFRLGVPLAAAAAIVLAVTVTTWFGPSPQRIQVAIGPTARTMMVDSAVPSIAVVSFVRPTEASAAPQRAASIGFATIGVEPMGVGLEESVPL